MGALISCCTGHKNDSHPDEIISSSPQRQYQSNTHLRTERENLRERPYEYNSADIRTLQKERNLRNLEEQNETGYRNAFLAPAPRPSYEINTDLPAGCKKLSPSANHYTQDSIATTFYERGHHGGVKLGETHLRTERENLRERPYEYNSVYIRTLQKERNLRNLEEQNETGYRNAFLAPAPRPSYEINTDLPAGCKKLSPSAIHYTQDSIATTFYERGRHGGVKLGETLDDLLRNRIQIKDIPRITVCWHKQQWFSLDNRRLWVLKNYEKIKGKIQIIVHVTMFMDEEKFTTMNNGKSIRVRGNPGGSYWKTFNIKMYQ